MDASHQIGIYFEKVLDILGEVRALRLVQQRKEHTPQGWHTLGKGFSTDFTTIHSFAMGLTYYPESLIPLGLQADLRRFEREFKEG